jgi:zinc-binding in reverse transcriptase
LRCSFNCLYSYCISQNILVYDVLAANRVDRTFLNQLNISYSSSRHALCLQFSIILEQKKIFYFGISHKINNFSCKSLYKFLTDTSSPSEHIVSIWKLQVSSRILAFACLMLKNKILTVDNLQRKGWTIINRCALCKNHEESIPHLFHSYSFFRQLLVSTLQSLNQYNQFLPILETPHQLYL